jgi:NAD(P)-dependent dehydrogenase (short-subunit alcohol dehydrogenase family)
LNWGYDERLGWTALLMDFLNTPEKRERRVVHLPMGRFGEAIEQARGALFLASEDSSYVTGTDFMVDGGAHACYVVRLLPPIKTGTQPFPALIT